MPRPRSGSYERLLTLAVVVLGSTGCTGPGGSMSGHVRDLAGANVKNATVVLHFSPGGDPRLEVGDDGSFKVTWSHGSRLETVTAAATASGYSETRSPIGPGSWICEFRLVPATGGPPLDLAEPCTKQ